MSAKEREQSGINKKYAVEIKEMEGTGQHTTEVFSTLSRHRKKVYWISNLHIISIVYEIIYSIEERIHCMYWSVAIAFWYVGVITTFSNTQMLYIGFRSVQCWGIWCMAALRIWTRMNLYCAKLYEVYLPAFYQTSHFKVKWDINVYS